MLGKESSKPLRDARATTSEQSSRSMSSAKENSEAGPSSRKRRRSVTDEGDIVSKRPHNEETKFAKSVVGRDGTPEFDQFLDILIRERRLEIMKRNKINPVNMSSILNRARANAAKAFENLYDLWFDAEGNKTQYLKTLEKEGINLSNISSILGGAGANAAKAFTELYDLWFDAEGNKTQYLQHFVKKKNGEESFTLHNLSGMLSRAGANVKDAFEKLHSVCFYDKGERTELLDDFYKAGFKPSNLSCMLSGSGVRTSSTLKKLHSVCFTEKRKKTKLLDDLCKAGFRPCDLCSILSGAADSLEKFHDFCFIAETKKYLYHFLNEKNGGFAPSNLSRILHGAKANICSALKNFHDVCFDKMGNKTQLLDDFYQVGFRPKYLSNVLSMAGNNAASMLRNFHTSCFQENYLNHFLAREELFSPKNLSTKILYGVGINICTSFEKFHDLCFDKAGNKTEYLKKIIKNKRHEVFNMLYEKVRGVPFTSLDDI